MPGRSRRDPDNYLDVSSLPFQVLLGALLPRRVENLLPACKNVGTTHVTNGCFRLHPVEWAIGEAAGALAAFQDALRRQGSSSSGRACGRSEGPGGAGRAVGRILAECP